MSDAEGSESRGLRERFGWGDNQAWTFSAEVLPKDFLDVATPVAPIAAECKLDITPESLHIRAVDPAKVCAVEVESDCVRSADGEASVRVNIGKAAEESPGFWPGDEVPYTLQIERAGGDETDDEFRVFHPVEGEYSDVAYPPESTRELGDGGWPEPDEGHDVEFTMPSPKVRGVLGSVAHTSAEYVELSVTDGELVVTAMNRDQDELFQWAIDAPVSDGPEQIYSANYVSDIAEGMWPEGDVRVRFGHDQVLDLKNDTLRYALAPRIKQEDI